MGDFSPSTLDQAITDYKANPTEYNRQRVLAAQRQTSREFMIQHSIEYKRRTMRPRR